LNIRVKGGSFSVSRRGVDSRFFLVLPCVMALTLRFILSLLLLHQALVFVAAHQGDSRDPSPGKNEQTTIQKLPAPEGCKKIPIDTDWPSPDVINKELPGWEAPMPDGKMKHPDYIYDVKTVASVQQAVRFAAKHNIRLSIINSGHDFLGR
jgi:hypothetical protein